MFSYSASDCSHNRENQYGMTLISLMISTVIVLLGVLVSLRLHSNHEQSVERVRSATAHDRLIMSTLTIARKEIPGAGYRIAGADQDDVITVFTAATSSAPASRSIMWRYREGTSVECHGLRETEVTIDTVAYRQLELIGSSADCNTTSALNTLYWLDIPDNLGLWEVRDTLATYVATNGTLFNFQLSQQSCSNSRLKTPALHLVATVSAPNIAELNGASVPSNTMDLCLVNISPS